MDRPTRLESSDESLSGLSLFVAVLPLSVEGVGASGMAWRYCCWRGWYAASSKSFWESGARRAGSTGV
jgi:hypothetical protein